VRRRGAAPNGDAQVVGYYEDSYGYGYLVLGHKTNTMGRLSKGNYTLSAVLGSGYMPSYVDMANSTFNVYSLQLSGNSVVIAVNLYGSQDMRVRLPFTPTSVSSNNDKLVIDSWSYAAPFVTIKASGKNIQGELGSVTIH
jgi:hypothetical protein